MTDYIFTNITYVTILLKDTQPISTRVNFFVNEIYSFTEKLIAVIKIN